jgi:hypothetical protein
MYQSTCGRWGLRHCCFRSYPSVNMRQSLLYFEASGLLEGEKTIPLTECKQRAGCHLQNFDFLIFAPCAATTQYPRTQLEPAKTRKKQGECGRGGSATSRCTSVARDMEKNCPKSCKCSFLATFSSVESLYDREKNPKKSQMRSLLTFTI